MDINDPKSVLFRYLDVAHDALLWKVEGLSEYDARRPRTGTGTNLLGLVKHLALVELGYFTDVFDRPRGIEIGDDAMQDNADMYATATESRSDIMDLFEHARAQMTATIEELDLDHRGYVPWWEQDVTLQWIIIHMTSEIHRHLGQADILRENLDGSVGMREGATNLPPADEADWPTHVALLESIAAEFR